MGKKSEYSVLPLMKWVGLVLLCLLSLNLTASMFLAILLPGAVDISRIKNRTSLSVPLHTANTNNDESPTLSAIDVPLVCHVDYHHPNWPVQWKMTEKWDNHSVSYTSQCSEYLVDRFSLLVQMWDGPIVLAVHTNTGLSIDNNLISQWKQIYCQKDVYKRTTITFFTKEDQSRLDTIDTTVYPINVLRNLAWSLVETEYTFVIDMDFTPTPFSHELMRNHSLHYLSNKESHNALIIPAFEKPSHYGKDMPRNLFVLGFPNNKEELVALAKFGVYGKFASFDAAYGPTLYPKYLRATNPYEVQYKTWFEPFVIVRTDTQVRFWKEFAGYGLNYSSWSLELASEGYRFIVLDNLYIIHWSHSYNNRTDSNYLDDMRDSFIRHISSKNTTDEWRRKAVELCYG